MLSRLVQKRSFSLALKYATNGQPLSALKLENFELPKTALKENEVSLKFLLAPINPSDINMIEGTYGLKVSLPAVGGNEGLAEVVGLGSKVSNLKVGDWVVPSNSGFGTWRQTAVTEEQKVMKVPNNIPAAYAATLSVNPATSYRLLRDFADLKPGDVIIQNAATSMVGLGVVQMAREMGIQTINIVRSTRPNATDMLRLLTNLGGTVNLLDTQVNTPVFREILADLPPVKLAFNGVGGESAVELARALSPGGTMVTYGGMSKHAPILPLDLITDKNISLKGFWVAKWDETHSRTERQKMFEDIAKQIANKQLAYFFELHDMDDFEYALTRVSKTDNYIQRKVLLNLNFPDRFAEQDKLDESEYDCFKFPLTDE